DPFSGAVQYITGGGMSVDFTTGSMNVGLQSTLGSFSGSGDVSDFYQSGLFITTSDELYNGNMQGVFVANGAGAITNISVSGLQENTYQGTAVFQTGTPPVKVDVDVGVGQIVP